MLLMTIGIVFGVLIGGGGVWFYNRHQTTELRTERNLLAGRLRSILALTESGLLRPEHPDVRHMLLETQRYLSQHVPSGEGVPDERVSPSPPEGQKTPAAAGEDEEVPPLFDR